MERWDGGVGPEVGLLLHLWTHLFSEESPLSFRRFLLAAAGLLAVAATAAPAAEGAPRRPNLLLIVADDLGSADVGFRGAKVIRTPNLDGLARDGAVLDQFYVQPVCSPTRACLLTGRFATHTGIYTIVRPGEKRGLPLEERTLAQALREAGYFTAISGKWHLGDFDPAYRPTQRGFHRQYGHYFGMIDYFDHTRDGRADWHRDDQPIQEEGYSTHLITNEAVKIVKEKPADKPLFLVVTYNGVHTPLQVPESYREPYTSLAGDRRTIAGMISAVDEGVGKIVAALREAGELENTYIVFTSDNGGPSPGRLSDNGVLRAGKGTLYEGGVRACAFIRGPGVEAGTLVKEPLHAVDVYPTLIGLGGGELGAKQKLPLDGIDARSILLRGKNSSDQKATNEKPSRDALLLLGTRPGDAALRVGDWKLLRHAPQAAGPGPQAAAASTAAAGEAKPAEGPPAARPRRKAAAAAKSIELYDLAADPSEKNDLASTNPEKVKELSARLDALLQGQAPYETQ